jgi:hypothetical protein
MAFLCQGKGWGEREDIAEEVVRVIRAVARGPRPAVQSSPSRRDEYAREGWARLVANDLVNAALGASEREDYSGPPPSPDRQAMLREIARLALWHMRDAPAEARALVRVMEIERLKQPHPGDDPPPPEAKGADQ